MSIGISLLIFVFAFFFLFRASGMLVRSLGGLAQLFRLSEYVVAFVFVSAATSISELFVGVTSAIDKIPALSLGDVLGANLLNMTVVLGVAAFLQGKIETENAPSHKSFWFVVFLSFLPLFLGLDGELSRSDGVALLIAFFIYMGAILESRERAFDAPSETVRARRPLRDLVFFVSAAALLLASSYGIVWSAERITTIFTWKLLPFGALVVALGTTLPELAFGIRSAFARRAALAVGNSLGSVAFNSAFIMGIVSIIHPIGIAGAGLAFPIIGALALAFALFATLVYRKAPIGRREGTVFIAIYAAYIVLEYFV